MDAAGLGIYVVASMALILTPGQDMLYVISRSLAQGKLAGVCSAVGVIVGILVHTALAAFGVGAILMTSEALFLALKLAGAAYLVYLGGRALHAAVRRRAVEHGAPAVSGGELRQGLLSNLGNPKMAVFFSSLLPQFADAFLSLLALGLLFCALTMLWLSAYAAALARARDVLRRPRVRRAIDALTGTALVALGLRLATAER